MIDRIEILHRQRARRSTVRTRSPASSISSSRTRPTARRSICARRRSPHARRRRIGITCSLSGGFDSDRFDAVYRRRTDVAAPAVGLRPRSAGLHTGRADRASRAARRAFLRTQLVRRISRSGCGDLRRSCRQLNDGSTYLRIAPGLGHRRRRRLLLRQPIASIGYGTMIEPSARASIAARLLGYELGNDAEWFADVQLGYHEAGNVPRRRAVELSGARTATRKAISTTRPTRPGGILAAPVLARGNGRPRARHDPQPGRRRSASATGFKGQLRRSLGRGKRR